MSDISVLRTELAAPAMAGATPLSPSVRSKWQIAVMGLIYAEQRLPHMTAHDVGEIDREIRDALMELGEG
jgi:hypothetical protein